MRNDKVLSELFEALMKVKAGKCFDNLKCNIENSFLDCETYLYSFFKNIIDLKCLFLKNISATKEFI